MVDPTVRKVSQAAGHKNRCASAFSTLGNRLKRNPAQELCKCLFKNTLPLSDKHHHHCQESNWEEALCRGRRGLGTAHAVCRTASVRGSTDKLLKETRSSDMKIF